MTDERKSLRRLAPRRHDIPALTMIALVVLTASQFLPVMTVDQLGPSRATYSILTGVLELARSGNILIALIIFSFSVVFPFFKLIDLLVIWFRPMDPDQRVKSLRVLKVLGKWSMLDVYVVVVLAGAVQLGILAEAHAERGIYVFAGAILGSLLATWLMSRVAEATLPVTERSSALPRQLGAHLPVLGTLAFGLFAGGIFVPLMHVEEWLFWDREYSIVSGTWELFATGEVFLPLAVLVFVIVLPFVSFLTLMVLSIVPFTPLGRRLDSRHRLLDLLRAINKWSMFDVFALAVLVVITKIGGLASVEPRLGLWLCVSGALVSMYVSWKIG